MAVDMASAIAGPTPSQRVWLVDSASGEQLSEQVGAEYARAQIPGLSHTVRQFSNTADLVIEFDLEFRAWTPEELNTARRARRFLHAACYPRSATSDAHPSRPPRMMLVWPGTLLVTGIITGVKIKHTRFNRQSTSVGFIASITFEEFRTTRITSEDVFNDTELRLGGGA